MTPPVAPRFEHTDNWHGDTFTDHYRWLHDKSNPEVIRYLEAENAYTEAVTSELKPFAQALYGEMLSHIKQTDLSVPVPRSGYLYYFRTEEGLQYPIHCRRKRTPSGAPEAAEEILLDLNQLANEYKFISLGSFVVSDDQNLLAYTLDYSGFRQYTLIIKDLRTGSHYPDTLERVTSLQWGNDNQTLFIVTEDAVTKRSDTLLRHSLGTAVFEPLYTETDELYDIGLEKTRNRKYILLHIGSKDTTEFHYVNADQPLEPFTLFLQREKGHRYHVDHRDDLFYIRTDKDAKNFRIVTAPESDPSPANWRPFIDHRPDVLIEELDLFRDFAVVIEKAEAVNRLRVHNFKEDTWTPILFPEPVYSAFQGGTRDFDSTTYRYSYQSFITPPSIFDYDTLTGESTLLKRQEVPGYDPSRYVSERLWITARDGAKVPISIVYPKTFQRDGNGPLLLYAYGSYGSAMPVMFSSSRLSLLDRGMAYAIAHIRGGNEMGELWRDDGMLMKKTNTFFDFIDCAESLIRERWTSSKRLVIEGGSAGGLLMGVVANLRPDLFRAIHSAVPFVDVLNTMMDASLPLTVGEYLEWGNPNEKAAFDYIRSYSPYDNLKPQPYPAILVTTSLNDSQVMYWEPAKYVAKLRTLNTGDQPILLKIKLDPAGHGGASGRYDRLKDQAFEYAWLLSQVGLTESLPR